jgi:hypothetical protein
MVSLTGLLWRIRNYLPESTRLLFYNSYFVPLMDYCINVWGQSNKTLLDKIYAVQKRILRIVSNDYTCDTKTLFQKHNNIMSLHERIEFQTATLTYKCLFDNVPNYLKNFFRFAGNDHNYNLRNNGICLVVPKPKTEIQRKSFRYVGAVAWNELPISVKTSPNTNCFKKNLKQYIYQKKDLR